MILGRFHMVAYVGADSIGPLQADVRPATPDLLDDAIERDLVVAPTMAHQRIAAGDVALVRVVDNAVAGIFWICPTAHRDEHFGLASRPTRLGVYGHQLLVHTDARGKGIGHALLLGARHHAAATFDRHMHTLVDPTNQASVKAHERAGYRAAGAVRGIRIGRFTIRPPRPVLPLTPLDDTDRPTVKILPTPNDPSGARR